MEEQLHIFEVWWTLIKDYYIILLKVSFDHEKARKDGIIIPHKGVNQAYDNALTQIANINNKESD